MRETLICYDICCPRRLARVYRALCRRALPIQYSVFLHHGTWHQLRTCLQELEQLMDPAQDDIRAYPLPHRGLRWSLGKPVLPADILYTGHAARMGTDGPGSRPVAGGCIII